MIVVSLCPMGVLIHWYLRHRRRAGRMTALWDNTSLETNWHGRITRRHSGNWLLGSTCMKRDTEEGACLDARLPLEVRASASRSTSISSEDRPKEIIIIIYRLKVLILLLLVDRAATAAVLAACNCFCCSRISWIEVDSPGTGSLTLSLV